MNFLQRVGNKMKSAVQRVSSALTKLVVGSEISKKTIDLLTSRLKSVQQFLPMITAGKREMKQRVETDTLLNLAKYTVDVPKPDLLNGKDPAVQTITYNFDTSDNANVVFRLGDEDTARMFLRLKDDSFNRVDRKITSNKTGYKLTSRLHFVSSKSGAIFEVPFYQKDLSFREVQSTMEEKDIEYGGDLSYITFLYSVNPGDKGGCAESERHKKIKLGNDRVRLTSVKSRNNNCAFQCYLKFLNISGRVEKPDAIRKKLKFELNTKIYVHDLPKISDYFKIGHIVYFEDQIVGEYGLDREKIITLYLDCEHYHYVSENLNKKKCEECGQKWIKTHNCNPSVATYFQSRVHSSGKVWEVPPKDRIKENEQDLNKLVFWDCETFPDKMGKHQPYAIGWKTEGKYYSSQGKDCLDEFLDFVMETEGKVFLSFNGAKFDHYFVYKRLINRGIVFKTKDLILNNGRILKMKLPDIKSEFKDLYQFMPTLSLEKACDQFGCTVAKGSFDHNLIKSWDDVETNQGEWSPYLKLDVECLEELYTVFAKTVYDITKFHVSDFLTLSAMSFDFWKTSIPKMTVEKISDKEKKDFINNSVYGGRCYPLQKEWRSPYYDAVIEGKMSYADLKKTQDGFIFNADATSLYPASMCRFEYPVGLCRWSDNPSEDFKKGLFGIFHVRWECENRRLRVPVLPVRGCNGLDQTLIGREGIYNNIDIQNAMSCGYSFVFIGKALVWDQSDGNLFKEFILKWFEIKKQNSGDNGNKALRTTSKLSMNSLYGKMLQGQCNDNMAVCGTIHDFWLFTKTNRITAWISNETDDGTRFLTLFGVSTSDNLDGKPRHLGSFIVAYAKRIMLEFMKEIDPTLESCVFSYHDTDSLHIKADAYHKLLQKGFVQESGDSDLGMLCNDTKKDGLIIYEKNLGAKNYMYIYLGNDGVVYQEYKCKGLMKTDRLDGNKPILTPDLYEDENSKALEYKSFQRIMKPTKAQREIGLTSGDIRTVVNKRTFLKNGYDRMIYKDNNYYPMGFDFSSLEDKECPTSQEFSMGEVSL